MSDAPHTLPLAPELLARLEGLRVRARKQFLGSRKGTHLSPRRGSSLEFADHRRYVPGDDLRYVDWGLFGRTDRHYVKRFHEEEDLHTYLFVDASGSMAVPEGTPKYATASRLALALAYVALASDDPVKLHLLGPSAAASPFVRGRRHLLALARFAAARAPAGQLAFTAALLPHLRALRRPGKAIVISDLLFDPDDCRRGLRLLIAANLDVAVLQVLAESDVAPPLAAHGLVVVDVESGREHEIAFGPAEQRAYTEALARHNRRLKSFCHQAGIHYALLRGDTGLADFVLRELPALGLLV